MKLTYKDLKAKRPCKDQLKIYMDNFPDGLEITKEDLLKAQELGLDIQWFAFNFLPAPAREAYNNKATAPAWEAYREAMVTARKAYDKATATALWDILQNLPPQLNLIKYQ